MSLLIYIMILAISGCTTIYTTSGQYKEREAQDYDCWKSYGAEIGYCDAVPDKK